MYEFNGDDLRSNQRDFISQSQKEWLQILAGGIKQSPGRSLWVTIFFMSLGFCLIFGLFLSNESSRRALFSSPVNILVILALIPIVFALIGIGYLYSKKMSDKLLVAQLERVEGVVILDQDFSSTSGLTSYYVFVNKERFAFGNDMSAVFHEGKNYRIYYIKSMMLKLILSYEKLS